MVQSETVSFCANEIVSRIAKMKFRAKSLPQTQNAEQFFH